MDVKLGGTFSRHGVTIITVAILGGAIGAAAGYAIAMHTGMSRGWAMGLGGFVGFAVAGGVTYMVFHSIDSAELAAEKFVERRLEKAGIKIKPSKNSEAVEQLISKLDSFIDEAREGLTDAASG